VLQAGDSTAIPAFVDPAMDDLDGPSGKEIEVLDLAASSSNGNVPREDDGSLHPYLVRVEFPDRVPGGKGSTAGGDGSSAGVISIKIPMAGDFLVFDEPCIGPAGLEGEQAAEFESGRQVGAMTKTLIHELAHRQAWHTRDSPDGADAEDFLEAGFRIYNITHCVVHWLAFEASCKLAGQILTELSSRASGGGSADELPPIVAGSTTTFLQGMLAGLCCYMQSEVKRYGGLAASGEDKGNGQLVREATAAAINSKVAGGPPFAAGEIPFGVPSDTSVNTNNPIPANALTGFPQPGEDWGKCPFCCEIDGLIDFGSEAGQ